MNFLKENWFKIAILIVVLFGFLLVFTKASANEKYWLELGVAEYANMRDAYEPYLRSTIFSEYDAYSGGAAGIRTISGFTPSFPRASSDWYFKIGNQE